MPFGMSWPFAIYQGSQLYRYGKKLFNRWRSKKAATGNAAYILARNFKARKRLGYMRYKQPLAKGVLNRTMIQKYELSKSIGIASDGLAYWDPRANQSAVLPADYNVALGVLYQACTNTVIDQMFDQRRITGIAVTLTGTTPNAATTRNVDIHLGFMVDAGTGAGYLSDVRKFNKLLLSNSGDPSAKRMYWSIPYDANGIPGSQAFVEYGTSFVGGHFVICTANDLPANSGFLWNFQGPLWSARFVIYVRYKGLKQKYQ